MNRPVSVSTRRIEVAAGVGLQVAVAGDGPPLLALHGFPDHGGLWLPMLPLLARRYGVWMPDLRGYRHSDKPVRDADYRIEVLVGDVLALVQQIAAPVTLVGHDWGGMLAWAFAAQHPQHVTRLVVINAPHPCRLAQLLQTDPAQRSASAYLQRLAAPGTAALLAADDCARLRALTGAQGAELASLLQAWTTPGALNAMLAWYRALDADDPHAVPRLPPGHGRIAAPTLLLWGEPEGSFVAANLEGLESWVPHLQIQRFAGTGHWLPREQPAAVARAILDFPAQP